MVNGPMLLPRMRMKYCVLSGWLWGSLIRRFTQRNHPSKSLIRPGLTAPGSLFVCFSASGKNQPPFLQVLAHVLADGEAVWLSASDPNPSGGFLAWSADSHPQAVLRFWRPLRAALPPVLTVEPQPADGKNDLE